MKHKQGDLFCMAHKRFITEDDLKDRNCTKQPCRHLAILLSAKSFNVVEVENDIQ